MEFQTEGRGRLSLTLVHRVRSVFFQNYLDRLREMSRSYPHSVESKRNVENIAYAENENASNVNCFTVFEDLLTLLRIII